MVASAGSEAGEARDAGDCEGDARTCDAGVIGDNTDEGRSVVCEVEHKRGANESEFSALGASSVVETGTMGDLPMGGS